MTRKVDISERRSKLSPAKRALLEKRLRGTLTPDAKSQVISRRLEPDFLPLSFAQDRFWFLNQLEPDNPAYNRPFALRLTGPLHATALELALSEILRRHETLRATFSSVEGRPVQIVTPAQPLNLAVVDVSGLSPLKREARARQLVTEETQRPFDLAQGPLLRATLLRLDGEEHVLLLVMHHITCDGWSARVLVEELAALYDAFVAGKPSPLPELPIQYADFAYWQRQWLQGKVLETQLSYWQDKLAGSPPLVDLPTDHPRPAIQTYRGARESLMLSASLLQSLKALSQQEGVTLFMTLLAAFQTLLHRYTGQDDIVVGSPIAGRTHVETERLIGFFVNTLALRTDLSGNPTFRELLGRVRKMAMEAYAHQDLPFEKLLQELKLERDLSRPPLFQVLFNLENIPIKAVKTSSLSIDEFEFDSGASQFDLALEVIEKDEGLSCLLNYSTDLFDAATIERMLGHYQTLLEGIVADPGQRIGMLPLLTEAERHQLLVEWNDTQADCPQDSCIHQLFEAQVERTPDAVAVVFEDQQLTYRQLNARANQLAHYLRKRDVGPEVLVGICVERSLEMVVGLLGILKAGGAYVPLDPTYPKERLAFMLEDAQAPVLLTQQRLMAELPKHRAEVVCLDTDWEAIARESEENPVSGAMADNLAYVIYTSGSTGKPKGVLVSHHNVVRLFEATQPWFHFDDSDVWTLFHSYAFDFSVWEFWGALFYGGRLVVVPYWVSRSPEAFYDLLCTEGVTVLNQTPSAFRQLIRAEESSGSAKDLPLRLVIFGGEALELQSLKPWFDRHGDQCPQLVNMYGITETTVHVTYRPLTVKDLNKAQGSVIGGPIPDLQVYILDQQLQPVPIGVPGEMYIGGAGLSRGYLNRSELNAERFTPNPFSDKLGARLYKSGDLARYLPNGDIEYLGRMDHQVKIRGFRIELGEIETVLGQHPTVRETVVMARKDILGDNRLVAYVVPNQKPAPTTNELRSFLKRKLPEYMVPSTFMFLDALPLTPNGKVDRRALPAPDRVRPELERAFVAPRTPIEEMLAGIWAEVLGLEKVGIHDNFFELGGHSLLTVRLFTQIEKTFGKKFPLATLFQAPTIEQLASVLRQKGWSTPWSSLVAIQPSGSKPPFFCVPGILGNVFVDLGDLVRHLGPDQPFYGLQDGIQNPSQIKASAAHYVDEIRTVQLEGPYLLGGVCSGGVVAFEMAQQLQAQGQKVALLALVEPSPLSVPGLRTHLDLLVSILRRLAQRSGHHSRNLLQRNSAERGAYIRLRAKLVANSWALRRYAPRPYPGQIHLFLTSESLEKSSRNSRLGWRELATSGAEVHVIPGTHDAITRTHNAIPEESHLQVLAEQLRACIDGALTDDDRS
jgi:amino acid adenylation domain-containing protein